MKTLSLISCCLLVAVFDAVASTKTIHASAANLAEQAVSTDRDAAQKAQESLRAEGPQGLQALQQRFAKEIAAHRSGAAGDEEWKRIAAALDRVGGQYDDYSSGLYWYTDLDKARAAAQASGKPILSLRLLGRLDTDLSCANSRFFRTTLYPNAEISQLLRDRFILHWESVRPVPVVTIDFGDGRKLQRTITGNSIHYILDSDGKVVDALPGLYAAPVFAAELRQAADAVEQARNTGTHDYTTHLRSTQNRLLNSWAADLSAIHVPVPESRTLTEVQLKSLMDDSKWQQLAQLHRAEVTFDAGTREVMARKFPDAATAAPIAVSKRMVESPMMRAFTNLSATVSLDTVRNNYMLRTEILEYIAGQTGYSASLAQINDWVYADVFLTPRQDPWLGLNRADVFAAIDHNGETL